MYISWALGGILAVILDFGIAGRVVGGHVPVLRSNMRPLERPLS